MSNTSGSRILGKLDIVSEDRSWSYLLIAMIAVLLLVLRAPDALLSPEFWAEDGVDYWTDQFQNPFAIFTPSTGYLAAAPRLVALVADLFPSTLAPVLFNWLTIAFMGWLYYSIASLKIPYVQFLPIVMALTPTTGEILINATNIQWHLALLIPLSAYSPLSNNGRVLLGIAALTGPFSILALPVWALRFRTADRLGLAIVIAAAAIQIVTMLLTPQKIYAETGLSIWINMVDSLRQTFGVLTGERHYILSLVMLAAVVWLSRNSPVFWGALGFSVLVIAMANARFPMAPVFQGYGGARYFFMLNALSIWSLCASAYRAGNDRTIALIALGVVIGSYQPHLFRRAPLPATEWPEFATSVESGTPATVRVTPFTLKYDGENFEVLP